MDARFGVSIALVVDVQGFDIVHLNIVDSVLFVLMVAEENVTQFEGLRANIDEPAP